MAYWEPAKFVAKLREMKTDDNLLLLKCDMGAGHFSKSGRFVIYFVLLPFIVVVSSLSCLEYLELTHYSSSDLETHLEPFSR